MQIFLRFPFQSDFFFDVLKINLNLLEFTRIFTEEVLVNLPTFTARGNYAFAGAKYARNKYDDISSCKRHKEKSNHVLTIME